MLRTLNKDIRLLADNLGEALRAHGGETLFQHVETMRLAAKQAREADHPAAHEARQQLASVASTLEAETAMEVARAFMLYFQLVNLAEDVEGTRELRRREMEAEAASVADSLEDVVGEFAARGVARPQALETLREVQLCFVFTAHPTEARRRTTERLLAELRDVLEELDRCAQTPNESRMLNGRLRALVEALWEHAAQRRSRPEVLDEVKAGLWYVRHILLDAVPRMQRRLRHAIETHYGPVDPAEVPVPVRIGSWMGGDRDGNPNVTEAVTERTLELHHWIILDRYIDDLDQLVDPLAAFAPRLPPDADLDDALARAAAAVPELVVQAEGRNPDEPLRRLVAYMRARIQRTRTFSSGGYPMPDDFLDDLRVIRKVLQRAHARALPDDTLLDLIERVRCFGFHLAALDVREDARLQRRVVAELLDDPEYPDRSDEARSEALKQLRLPDRSGDLSAEARRHVAMFDGIRRVQARYGREAIPTYILSMAESRADVLEALRLAELHGIAANLDLVPLLETKNALQHTADILEGLFGDARYREHVRTRGEVQELLLGYSDSMKEAGILASRSLIMEAQRTAASVCARYGVTLRVFHGRGGSVSRGGGPTYRAIRALPRESFTGRMKITEQGETRAYHFGNPDLAVRYLEQTTVAAWRARWEARQGIQISPPEETKVVERLARLSEAAYRELIEDEGLVTYFEQATPLAEIGSLNITSRPTRRGGRPMGLEDLRAIPWVFAWSQSRHVLTGWYGVGTALSKLIEEHGVEPLSRLYEQSHFFFDLLDNVQMTLAKTDMPIAERYASLCTENGVRDRIFTRVHTEYTRTAEAILRITRQDTLLDEDPALQRSIRLRNPYVDPLSYIQLETLRRSRDTADPEERARWERVARLTVQGIAAGLRNTG